MEIDEENKLNYGGPMALVSKTNAHEDESEGDTKEDEEGSLQNSDDEAIAYYSNNRVKLFQETYEWKFQKHLGKDANVEFWWKSESEDES